MLWCKIAEHKEVHELYTLALSNTHMIGIYTPEKVYTLKPCLRTKTNFKKASKLDLVTFATKCGFFQRTRLVLVKCYSSSVISTLSTALYTIQNSKIVLFTIYHQNDSIVLCVIKTPYKHIRKPYVEIV